MRLSEKTISNAAFVLLCLSAVLFFFGVSLENPADIECVRMDVSVLPADAPAESLSDYSSARTDDIFSSFAKPAEKPRAEPSLQKTETPKPVAPSPEPLKTKHPESPQSGGNAAVPLKKEEKPVGLAARAASLPSAIISAVGFKAGTFKPSQEITVPIVGNVRVQVIDSRTFCIIGSYSEFLRERFKAECGGFLSGIESPAANLKTWSKNVFYNVMGAEIIIKYRPKIAEAFKNGSAFEFSEGIDVEKTGYWINPTGQAHFPRPDGGEDAHTRNAFVAHYAFFKLAKPLESGKQYSVKIPLGQTVSFKYDDLATVSGAIKANQLGYSPKAERKYAYMGAWLGSLGASDMSEFANSGFELLNAKTGAVEFSGKIEKRIPDPDYNGSAFTGENTYQLDFSKFSKEGEYVAHVKGVGVSYAFSISNSAIGDAFYIHMKGLYHKRCGTPKQSPFTNWIMGECHMKTFVSNFPPNDLHYKKKIVDGAAGFFNESGRRVDILHFKLIEFNHTDAVADGVFGGWHDAADYDRRPCHYDVVNDLLSVYLFRPSNFADAQLNIPESSNGIPDIIDEAAWGVELWRKAQKSDGSTGAWIEATSHPDDRNPSTDKQPYYLSAATRESTMQYAAYASMLSLALRKAGAAERAQKYLESAERAYRWASRPENRFSARYRYPISKQDGGDGKTLMPVSYSEAEDVPAQFVFKAAFNLFLLTKNDSYRADYLKVAPQLPQKFAETTWRINPLFFSEFLKYGTEDPALKKTYAEFSRRIMKEADLRFDSLENYPYRIPWFAPSHPYVTYMSWGCFHPLVRAKFFVNAYELTKDEKYRAAAYLCNDWHNGANPTGQTMTSGMGYNFPATFLDAASLTYGGREYVLGITPYRNTFGIARDAVELGFALIYKPRADRDFTPAPIMLLPDSVTGGGVPSVEDFVKKVGKAWPVWRRYANVEAFSVPASEFTISETISPAAAVTGWLLEPDYKPSGEMLNRVPAENVYNLRGYAPLP